MPPKLTQEIIAAAIEGFQSQKRRIDDQITELRSMLTGNPTKNAPPPEAATGKRKKFSTAVRRKMALAQKARWAKTKGEAEPPVIKETPKPKRKLSAAGRAAIIAATKKMWAAKRAAAKAQMKVEKKRAPVKKPAVAQAATAI
jgi:hypothetical protein